MHSEIFKVPIISVGNIVLGGTGKTPMIIYLGKYLSTVGKKTMVLSRGHKGKREGSSGILFTDKILGYDPVEYGDEPVLLSRKMQNAAIVVGKKRVQNLKYYFKKNLPDVVLLDDGFQHLQLSRNLNIVLFDSLLNLDQYTFPPLGYLREGFRSLQDADIIVLGRVNLVEEIKIKELTELILPYTNPDTLIVHSLFIPIGVKNINHEKVMEMSELEGRRVLCVVGIASPDSFLKMLNDQGANVVEEMIFSDHYHYTSTTIKNIQKKAKEHNALILTTEKDLVKIKKIGGTESFHYIDVSLDIIEKEREFLSIIQKVID